MSQKFAKGLAKDEQEGFLQQVRAARVVMEQLINICEQDMQSSIKLMRKPETASNHGLLNQELGKQAYAETIITMVNNAMKEKESE